MKMPCTRLSAIMLSFSLCACSGPDPSPVAVAPESTEAPETVVETSEPPAGAEAISTEAPAPAADPAVPALSVDRFVGDYATTDYARRGEGYDWIGVTIEKMSDQTAYIRVRSRGDMKRPTCSFDGVGTVKSATVLETAFDGHPLLFTLEGDTLKASVTSEDDQFVLSYFCSGGATLEGPYARLPEGLEREALASEAFSRELSLQEISFEITANDSLPLATLVVRPKGLALDNSFVVRTVEGQVTDAEIEDLNSDGWPEVMVYYRANEPSGTGSVLAYSVNNGKSMSEVTFPPLEGDALVGYRGGDEFSVVETSLGRRFRVYKEGDVDGAPTGPMRQLRYKLEEGEASRTFRLVDVVETPLP